MHPFAAEVVGTALLILLGNGIVANVVLKGTKGNNSGWIVITLGWGMAVFLAVFVAGPFSGAHINPAVTIGLAMIGKLTWGSVPMYIAAQMIGASIGAILVWVHYIDHFAVTEDKDLKLAVFCTAPAIRNLRSNLISEVIGTFVLVFAVFYLAAPEIGLGSIDALPVGLVVFVIGAALGGTTGYAINPARDLAPRIMHALLPIPNKRNSDWGYAWIPVLGPIAGASIAALAYLLLGS